MQQTTIYFTQHVTGDNFSCGKYELRVPGFICSNRSQWLKMQNATLSRHTEQLQKAREIFGIHTASLQIKSIMAAL